MSDTPRTDDASDDNAYYQSSIEMIPADFARQLERELTTMTKERDALREQSDALARKLAHQKGITEAAHKETRATEDDYNDMRKKRNAFRDALMRLHDAADVYAACQDDVLDERCGNVQPITAQEGRELNEALAAADKLLTKTNS